MGAISLQGTTLKYKDTVTDYSDTVKLYNVNGQILHTVDVGKPNRQVALMIHGWSGSWYAMSPLIGLLSQRFRVIAIDLPGYGKSPPLSRRTTINEYVEFLADFIDKVSDSPVVLVGHSMGGMISITLAIKHPALVERMVLLNPTITGRLSNFINIIIAPIFSIERFLLGSLLISGVEKVVIGITDRMMRPVSFAERSGITLEDYKHLMADARRRGQGRVRADCFFAMRENNLSGLLRQVETPSLVLWGAEDNTVPLREAGVVADEWPAADLRIIPKAGHWPHFEAPDITRRLVASFLGLPLLSDKLSPVDDDELDRISKLAEFLTNSDLGTKLRRTQLIRLAGQFRQIEVPPRTNIVNVDESGNVMYLVYSGTVEVWSDPENPGPKPLQPRKVAEVQPGQITGELAMIDQGTRTADLITGGEGATVLALERERLLALMEDDPELGTRLLWNIATAMSHRVRFILWQLNRAQQRAKEAEKQYKYKE